LPKRAQLKVTKLISKISGQYILPSTHKKQHKHSIINTTV